MGLLDTFKGREYKQKLDEAEAKISRLEAMLTPEMKDMLALEKEIDRLKAERNRLDEVIEAQQELEKTRDRRLRELDEEAKAKEAQIVTFDDAILVQEFGLYDPRFDFANSSLFKDALKECRGKQKELIRDVNKAADSTSWTVNGSAAQGKKMVKEISRLIMRAYNGECDEIVRKVKASNVNRSIEQVYKTAETISKLGSTIGIQIPGDYRLLKEEEVRLAYEFAIQKEKEKEALREAREREREERKLAQEIAAERKKLEKEKKQYAQAYKEIQARIASAAESERAALEEKAEELKGKLDEVDAAVANVDYREANQKAGFVYVISNIGSFGEGVYKIGMTRRLDPMERVKELGDASVPFNFDVHAMIFCDDAPKLEAALHREFESRKINIVNQRREFFKVSLEEIEDVVKRNYDKTVEFTAIPDAEQYRTSEKLRERGIYSCE